MPKKLITKKTASAMGKKGGTNKKGYKSLKTIVKEIFANGDIDQYSYVKSHMLHAMKGNSGISKLIWEQLDGKVKEEIDLNAKQEVIIRSNTESDYMNGGDSGE